MNQFWLTQKTIANLFLQAEGYDREFLLKFLMGKMEQQDQEEVLGVLAGRCLPSLSADIIAKKVFDPDEHPERLQKMLRDLTGDDGIVVGNSFRNEGYIQSESSKKVIFDIPARLLDGRISDLEVQAAAQEFIFERADIYSAELLMMQYSVEEGQKKSELDYGNVCGTLVIVLMKESPDLFECFPSERYIHRFCRRQADSGLSYQPLSHVIYVQLDKCFAQFRERRDGEDNKELQLLLSMIADINDEKVRRQSKGNKMMEDIYEEVFRISQDREVQAMWFAEKYVDADWNAAKEYQRRKGKKEMALELLKNGVAPDIIAASAEVSVETVEQWAQQIGISVSAGSDK
ncbi:MAG TPA: Rpn family recombination-promoting nuclease/putative transposase [Candidatus Anaerobutyricum stercoris]|uniref:Rpn family recombination-promoting nuclease/putative transposase n=1 Tax=Candidatus Anaerobutyricum stercoris TaxID=2838457 RepID=A0A9D2ENB2_9FIRM|nr:Rpn family recombination-promoting nuclease/putative transposase [Candidatus Anaerobutyricum stercoris]